jgi:hypothetical protein
MSKWEEAKVKKILCITLSVLTGALWANSQATYSVPAPRLLSAYASFPLDEVSVTVEGKEVHICYKLPREIVDNKIHNEPVEFTGTLKPFPEQFTLKSKEGDDYGTCFVNQLGLSCLLTYGFHTNLSEVNQFLKAKYPKSEVDLRSQVAKVFSNEPGGILHFPGHFPLK